MKSLIRSYSFHLLALWLAHDLLQHSFTITGNLVSWLVATGILTLLNLLLKPILKLLFFPVNALSLGLFSFVINFGVFYIFIKLVPAVIVNSWNFPGISLINFHLEPITLSILAVIFLLSLFISLITGFGIYLVE